LSAAKPIKYRPVMQMGFAALNPSYGVWPVPFERLLKIRPAALKWGVPRTK
jgi:hypothetical protein